MTISFKTLHDQVIVITGAGSDIGLAAAQAVARQGAKVVLVEHNRAALANIIQDLIAQEGQVVPLVVDMNNRAEFQRIADIAVQHFGRIDTWVNAGGSSSNQLGNPSQEDPPCAFEMDYWGSVYASHVAIQYFKQHGGGKLINLDGMTNGFPSPEGYSTTKRGLKSFTDSLRKDLEEEQAPISITFIKPNSNKPYPQPDKNGANHQSKKSSSLGQPIEVVNAILYAATHDKRDICLTTAPQVKDSDSREDRVLNMREWRSAHFMVEQQLRPQSHKSSLGRFYRAITHPVLTTILVLLGITVIWWLSKGFGS